MAMEAYESYKNVDLPWLKRVPEHWEVKRIGSLFSQRIEKVSDKVYAPLSVTKYGIVPQLSDAAKTNNGDDRKLVCVGDFVINSRSDRKGSSGLSKLEGSVAKINLVLKPRTALTGKYIHYLLKSNSFIEEYYRNGRGIVADLWTTGFSDMKTIWLPVPPKKEQDQIVRYLDWQNSRLNKLINAKKKEIALLEEQKQALISQAVTKGLDPNAPLKDSAIDWIGQIPEHWEIKTINNMFMLTETRNRDMKIIDAYQFKFGEIVQKTKLKLTKDLIHTYQDYTIVQPNDIVFNGLNLNYDFVTQRIGIVKNLGIITSSYISIRPRKDTNSCFYAYMLKSYDSKKVFNGMGTGIRLTVSWKQLKQLRILVPPKYEQQQIVQYLDKLSHSFHKLIKHTEKQVSLLQEYRTRLVADVVTGQIDVRNIAIPNYETVTETIDQPETTEDETSTTEE